MSRNRRTATPGATPRERRRSAQSGTARFVAAWIWLPCVALFFALPSSPAQPAASRTAPAVDYVPRLVGRTFLRAVAERDLETALSLCANAVQFDGRPAEGRSRVAEALRSLHRRVPASMKFRKVVAMDYAQMVERFGPPPKRLKGVRFKGSVVILGRLRRGGLIVVLNKIDGRWRVVALTD